MKILVLGCNGQLGRCLYDQLEKTDHNVIYTSRDQIDIADFEAFCPMYIHRFLTCRVWNVN